MPQEKRVLAEIAQELSEPFKHAIVGQVDEYCVYLTRIEGSYPYHHHSKDEMYLVLEGSITVEYDDGSTTIVASGESLVVIAGEKHRSRSDTGALVLMFKTLGLFVE